MQYVDSYNLFGIDTKQIPCIKGNSAPTTETEGAVGLFYMNTTDGKVYKCTAAGGGVYTWEEIGSGGAFDLPVASPETLGGVQPISKTDEMTQKVGVDENGQLWATPAAAPSDEQVTTAVDAYFEENPVEPTPIDETLTREGQAADAKAVGDALTRITITGEVKNYDTQPVGALFERPDGWNYVTWCSNALQFDPAINKYVNLAWARGVHIDESEDRLDTIYRVLINAETLLVEDISPIVMLDSDGVTDITTDLMEGASFIILKDGTYVYLSYLDDTSTYAAYRYTSTDFGKTWAKDPSGTGIKCPYKMRELANGRILFSTTEKGSGIWISDDRLRSATRATVTGGYGLAYGSYVSEWEFVELEENYIMAIGRKNGGGAGSEYSGDSDHALITYSTDNGTTWSQIVESVTIDNMNASNATSTVHDGIVEIFTTSRWYHSGSYTNNDNLATGKDGAMFHYVATIENAKADNFTNLGVVLYANGTNNSAQDFHAPCLTLNTKNNDALIVYMDRLSSIPDSENNNYHYVVASLGKVTAKINDTVISPVFAYSGREVDAKLTEQRNALQGNIDSLSSALYEEILSIKYILAQMGQGEVPEVPADTVMWTKTWEASEGAIADSVLAEYVINWSGTESDTEGQDSLGNTARILRNYSFIFPSVKNNFAVEVTETWENKWTNYIQVGVVINESLDCYFANTNDHTGFLNSSLGWAEKVYSYTAPVIATKRIVKRGDAVTFTLTINDEVIVEDYDVTQHPSLNLATYTTGIHAKLTEICAYLGAGGNGNIPVHSIKFGEWD